MFTGGPRPYIQNIRAVFFDLGDTLWHFPNMPPHDLVRRETWRRVFRLLRSWGYEVTEERLLLPRDIRVAVEEATEKAFWGDGMDPHCPEICRQVAARYGLELTLQQGEELWEAWNLGGAFLGRTLFPDALETLRWLRAQGYRLGTITNRGYGGPRFQEELRDLGLAELFEVVAVSCHVGYMKPHPLIYRHALESMGMEAAQAVMVGDSLRADVEGAKALGMTAIWRRPPAGEPVDVTEDKPDAGSSVVPDYIISTLADLKGLPIFQDGWSGK